MKFTRGIALFTVLFSVAGCAKNYEYVVRPRREIAPAKTAEPPPPKKILVPLQLKPTAEGMRWDGLVVIEPASGIIPAQLAVVLATEDGKIDFDKAVRVNFTFHTKTGADVFDLPASLNIIFQQIFVFPDGLVTAFAVFGKCTILSAAISPSEEIPDLSAANGQVVGKPYLINLVYVAKLEGECGQYDIKVWGEK